MPDDIKKDTEIDIEQKLKEGIEEIRKKQPEDRIFLLEEIIKAYAGFFSKIVNIIGSSFDTTHRGFSVTDKKFKELESTVNSLSSKHIKTSTDLEKFLKNFKWVVIALLILILREYIVKLVEWINNLISQFFNWFLNLSEGWQVLVVDKFLFWFVPLVIGILISPKLRQLSSKFPLKIHQSKPPK